MQDVQDTDPIQGLVGRMKIDTWGNKFSFGGYTVTVSSLFLAQAKFEKLRVFLCRPQENRDALVTLVQKAREEFESLTDGQVVEFIIAALENRTPTIFDTLRDYPHTEPQYEAFKGKMVTDLNLKPADNLYRTHPIRFPFQLNVHRGLYHNPSLIPQNSNIAVFNAYLAGIRNVEFDVLESKDFQSVVIHDVVTNRLDATYQAPPKYVDKWTWNELKDTPVNILDPLRDQPSQVETGLKLMRTEDYLYAIQNFMPEMTAYADARNWSPVSFFRLLKQLNTWPDLGKRVVCKIYPFNLKGGVYDVVKVYAERYTGKEINAAVHELGEMRPNVLLATTGLVKGTNERLALSALFDLGTDLNLASRTKTDDLLRAHYPYSRESKDKKYQTAKGQPLFTDTQLNQIDGRSLLFARWITDYSHLFDVKVLQVGVAPSLVHLLDKGLDDEVLALSPDERFSSAVNDNFMVLYRMVMNDEMVLQVGKKSLKELWGQMSFGCSDRYPDFSFAERDVEGNIKQDTLRDFYYLMGGEVAEKKGAEEFGAKLGRDTEYIWKWYQTLSYIPPAASNGFYVTTDLPTDLRVMLMELNGTSTYPKWMKYRPGGVVKKVDTPLDIKGWEIKPWSKQLFGNARKQVGFNDFYKGIGEVIKERDKYKIAIDALTAYMQIPLVLLNDFVLQKLNVTDGWLTTPVDHQVGAQLLKEMGLEVERLESGIKGFQQAFVNLYGVNYDGTPGLTVTEVQELPEMNWDI